MCTNLRIFEEDVVEVALALGGWRGFIAGIGMGSLLVVVMGGETIG